MNLLHLLQLDHRRFLAILETLDDKVLRHEDWAYEDHKTAAELLQELILDVERHERIEQELLAPALLRWAPRSEQELEKMAVEHGGLEILLGNLLRELPKFFEPAMKDALLDTMRLGNVLRSHILREEMDLYALAEKKIPRAELERLGEEALRAREHEVKYAQ